MGDLNYDLLQDSHTFTDDFVDIMYDHSFYPIINKPTRITQRSSAVHALILFGLTFTIKVQVVLLSLIRSLTIYQLFKALKLLISKQLCLTHAIFLNEIVPYLMKL